MINAERIKVMKDGAVILNFARDGIVDDRVVSEAIKTGKLYAYVCDFANGLLKDHEHVITLPHLGASTREAEDNCAAMVADEIRDYLENGNIHNAVNFPDVSLPRSGESRIVVANANTPNMVGQITTLLAEGSLNILDMLNKSRGELACTVLDVDQDVPAAVEAGLRQIEGVLNVRVIRGCRH